MNDLRVRGNVWSVTASVLVGAAVTVRKDPHAAEAGA